MATQWYKIFNETEFLAEDLPSLEVDVVLEDGPGLKTILITRGSTTGMVYEGVFLSLGINERNPLAFDGYRIFKDANNDVHLGIDDA